MLGKPEVRKAKGKDVFREVFLEGKCVLLSCLATFKTTSMALLFERSCREAGIGARIAPVPRKLSSSCGLACEFPCEERARAEALAAERRIEVAAMHDLEKI